MEGVGGVEKWGKKSGEREGRKEAEGGGKRGVKEKCGKGSWGRRRKGQRTNRISIGSYYGLSPPRQMLNLAPKVNVMVLGGGALQKVKSAFLGLNSPERPKAFLL